MTKIRNISLNLIYPGLLIDVPIESINNDSMLSVNDVIAELKKVPVGVEYVSANLSRGVFDDLSLIWNIGYMSDNEQNLQGVLTFRVLDDSQSPFVFDFKVGFSEYCEACKPLNSYKVVIGGLTLTELLNAGLIKVEDGEYDDDLDAAAGGILLGEYYRLSSVNTLGLPEGMIKMREV